MAVGKRTSTDQPLTEHDIADRLDKAAQRLLRIMYDLRVNHPEMVGPVRSSRYWTMSVNALAYELGTDDWNVEPLALRNDGPADQQPTDVGPGTCRVCGNLLGGEHGTEAMAHGCTYPGCAFGPIHSVPYHLVAGEHVYEQSDAAVAALPTYGTVEDWRRERPAERATRLASEDDTTEQPCTCPTTWWDALRQWGGPGGVHLIACPVRAAGAPR